VFEVNQPLFGSLSCAALSGLLRFPKESAHPAGSALFEPLFSQLLLKTAVYWFTCCPQNGTYID
jgi:hypothetical protein